MSSVEAHRFKSAQCASPGSLWDTPDIPLKRWVTLSGVASSYGVRSE